MIWIWNLNPKNQNQTWDDRNVPVLANTDTEIQRFRPCTFGKCKSRNVFKIRAQMWHITFCRAALFQKKTCCNKAVPALPRTQFFQSLHYRFPKTKFLAVLSATPLGAWWQSSFKSNSCDFCEFLPSKDFAYVVSVFVCATTCCWKHVYLKRAAWSQHGYSNVNVHIM